MKSAAHTLINIFQNENATTFLRQSRYTTPDVITEIIVTLLCNE